MPKVIAHLKEDIIDMAEQMLLAAPGSRFSVRELAQRLGIAPATIYNYYQSKEQLLGEIIARRWQNCLAEIDLALAQRPDLLTGVRLLEREVNDFINPLLRYWNGTQQPDSEVRQLAGKQEAAKQPTAGWSARTDAAGLSNAAVAELGPEVTETFNREGHLMAKKLEIYANLEKRMQLLLETDGFADSRQEDAEMLTRLVILCTHDNKMTIDGLLALCRRLEKTVQD